VQTSHHVNLRDPNLERISHGGHNFISGQLKRMRFAFLGPKGAELTRKQTDIRVVDVAVVNVGRDIAINALTKDVGDGPKTVEIP